MVKKISLSLYGAEDVPSRAFWLYGKVRAEGNKGFVSASWKDIEGPSLRQKSLRERYMGKVDPVVSKRSHKGLCQWWQAIPHKDRKKHRGDEPIS